MGVPGYVQLNRMVQSMLPTKLMRFSSSVMIPYALGMKNEITGRRMSMRNLNIGTATSLKMTQPVLFHTSIMKSTM